MPALTIEMQCYKTNFKIGNFKIVKNLLGRIKKKVVGKMKVFYNSQFVENTRTRVLKNTSFII